MAEADVLDSVLDASNVCIALVDLAGRFIRVNRAFASTHGLEPEAFAGRDYRDIYADQGAEDLYDELARPGFAALATVLATGESVSVGELPWRFPEDSARVVYYDSSMHPVRGRNGTIESIAFVSVDVTARHEAEAELRRIAAAQAALRRVATLVARNEPEELIFTAVAREAAELLEGEAGLFRYEEEAVVAVAYCSSAPDAIPVGTRIALGGDNVTTRVRETGRPERIDRYPPGDASDLTRVAHTRGVVSAAGAPIHVGGRLWGVAVVGTRASGGLPANAETHLADFTDLAGTAVANAEARREVSASRARLVATADEARRQIERDLHDGTQQRLVSLALQLRAAQASVPPGLDALRAEIDYVADGLTAALDELREVAHGIHPAVLAQGGLRPALKRLARRSRLPVRLDLSVDERLPEPVEVAAYYVVAEALTNAAKHAGASAVTVAVAVDGEVLRIVVEDDGVGGADEAAGSGLVGLRDRVAAIGGELAISSPSEGGTSLRVALPLSAVAETAA